MKVSFTEKFSYKNNCSFAFHTSFCILGFTLYSGFSGKFNTMSEKPWRIGKAEYLGAELFTNYSFH
ncbi:MAG: hypothetical protein IPG99_07550 [Ignavibacteria bacterium]|nr:hypothetical protein [Ignavibacteria bacterium]